MSLELILKSFLVVQLFDYHILIRDTGGTFIISPIKITIYILRKFLGGILGLDHTENESCNVILA